MREPVPRLTQHLSLNDVSVNLRLARRLPPALACRYHALPVAEDSDRITVAMADPDDALAQEAIAAALGTACCVVQGDPATIDALLAEVWPEEAHRSLRLLVCARVGLIASEVRDYAQAIGSLLRAHIGYFTIDDTGATLDALAKEAERTGYDLTIFGESDQLLLERLLSEPANSQATEQRLGSLLLARQPRWPLRRILLVIRGEGMDDIAVGWVVRLAGPSAAAVTVLTVTLPTPDMGSQETPLTTDIVLGQQMRRVARRLVDWEIESTLRLYLGPPDSRIRREVSEGNYDLVVVAAEPQCQGPHRLPGQWVSSLLDWANQPVLIARPTKEEQMAEISSCV